MAVTLNYTPDKNVKPNVKSVEAKETKTKLNNSFDKVQCKQRKM